MDKFEGTILSYKAGIEQLGLDLDILFIADASPKLPPQEGCVDYHIDFYGGNEYLLYHQNSFVEEAGRFLGSKAQVYGAYMYYPDTSRSRSLIPIRYPECSAKAHTRGGLTDCYRNAGFAVHVGEVGALLKIYNKYAYCCHVDGEPLQMCCFTAARKEAKA